MTSLRSALALQSSSAVLRYYTSAAPQAGRKPARLGKTLSLEHFLQRSRTLALYRAICRGCGRIQDPTLRRETLSFARAEFERHRQISDLAHIRYLLSTGKTEWDGMQRYVGSM
ncbi:LYR motif-containing protein [Microdochium nivale]|nr:LYR motif-containing protein [Microdochium nivale]